jgi:8-oxo-dGTP pyrophosphatase MutT (NUDIX family)
MMQEATLCFLVRGEPPREVLLGLKKTGFGAGKYAGFGGKIELGETVERAAVRELAEETGVEAAEARLRRVGHLTFLFPVKPAWNQVVHIFLVAEWDGDPAESVEMQPAWFALEVLPFERMWQDGAHWLPRVLAGQSIRARFTFEDDNETVREAQITETVFD